MVIILSNSADEPIYQQIITQIKTAIMSGELQPGGTSFSSSACKSASMYL